MRIRFSILIPTLLMGASIAGSVAVFQHEYTEHKKQLKQLVLDETALEMGQLQNVLYNRLSKGDEEEALLSLSLAAMRPGMDVLLLADERHRILLSSHYRHKGRDARQLHGYSAAKAEQAIRSGLRELDYDTRRPELMYGYFPLTVHYQDEGMVQEVGVLYVERDVARELEQSFRDAMQQSVWVSSITLGVSLFIGLLLHVLVSRQVATVSHAASRFAVGDLSVRTGMRGEDEIAILGRTFDLMAQKVSDSMHSQRQAMEEQASILHTAVDGYWRVDGEGRLVDVNEAYCNMSGYSRDELLQMSIPDLEAKEETPEEVRQHMEHILVQGYDRFETIHQRKDGSLFDVEISTTYWKDKHVFFAFIRDISGRRLVEIALQQERTRLKEAQQIGHFGSWELDLVSGKLIWSDEIFSLFEIDKSRFAASYEGFLEAIHPEDREQVNQAYRQSLLDRKPYQIVHRLLMKDGRIKWVEEHGSSAFDSFGKPLRSIGTVQDVTERESLLEQVRIASVAFETQEAILVTDKDVNIIKVNHAFEHITGYTSEEVLGQNPRILSSGRHGQEFYEAMWQAIIRDGSWSGEVWDRRKNGGVYAKWLTITAVKYLGNVTHYVAVFVDITERKKAEEEIRNLAFYDPLTHLPNRRLMLDRLHQALAQSVRTQSFAALMFMDLDYFKLLNDTKGHDYGDLMLVEVASRVKSCLRETDTVARFGGDEFVILLEGLSQVREEAIAQAGHIAEKVRLVLNQPFQLKDAVQHGSPSIGLVLFCGDGVGMDELLKQADLAMYQAKEGGRNQVRFFENSMQAVLESRTLMESALRQALSNDEMKLHYQVQVDVNNNLLGAEVLLRWHSPVLGAVSPAEFIPLAEKSNLILPIGRWVLETACRQLKAWEHHPVLNKLHLAVNISPHQFHQPDFVQQVKDILQETGADPNKLELELTENLVLDNVDEATEKMGALKALGARFSMDDFGTGYSSLQYIKRLPIDQLKIDQSFVRDILTDPGDAVMVQTIVGLAQNFGFDVIAEGVEKTEQLPELVGRGCLNFQGYLFAQPLPLQAFEQLIDSWDGRAESLRMDN